MFNLNPSLLREKLGVVSSLLILCCCAQCGVYGDKVPQPFLPIWMYITFAQRIGVAHLLSRFIYFLDVFQRELLCL